MSSENVPLPPEHPEPFPIFKLAHRYLLYDVDTVSYARREHHITGVLIGGLPQASQQNVFLGLPLELMPEEVRLLVEGGYAHIVDDVAAHKCTFLRNGLSAEERSAHQAALRRQGMTAARDAGKRAMDRKKAALKQKIGVENWNDIPEDMLMPSKLRAEKAAAKRAAIKESGTENGDESLFTESAILTENSPPPPPAPSTVAENAELDVWAVTPTTSYPPARSLKQDSAAVPDTPRSYPLFKHLHDQGYFLSPGLRFGCQYMAYPGDPLRFHSHFLCRGLGWEEEFALLDVVAGGRLGTSVKKGYLIGGISPASLSSSAVRADSSSSVRDERRPDQSEQTDIGGHDSTERVRGFCIEWAGM